VALDAGYGAVIFAVTRSGTLIARGWIQSVLLIGVQQRLIRHADIRTTMNIYGDAATPDMREASGKVATLALNGR